jgi:hypothetical protein
VIKKPPQGGGLGPSWAVATKKKKRKKQTNKQSLIVGYNKKHRKR